LQPDDFKPMPTIGKNVEEIRIQEDQTDFSSMRTRWPIAVAMLTSASSEKRDTRPRSMSFMRGWVIPHRVAQPRFASSGFSSQWPQSAASGEEVRDRAEEQERLMRLAAGSGVDCAIGTRCTDANI
jgi:hypothetical protein